MESLLITLLVFCIVAALVWYILGILPLPPVFKQVVTAIIVVIGCLFLINLLLGYSGHSVVRWR